MRGGVAMAHCRGGRSGCAQADTAAAAAAAAQAATVPVAGGSDPAWAPTVGPHWQVRDGDARRGPAVQLQAMIHWLS